VNQPLGTPGTGAGPGTERTFVIAHVSAFALLQKHWCEAMACEPSPAPSHFPFPLSPNGLVSSGTTTTPSF